MKKIILLILLACSVNTLFAQEAAIDTSWKKGGVFAVNFNQVSLTNWAAGGDNALSGGGFFSAFINYEKNKTAWDNTLDLAYGLTKTGEDQIRKNEDKIELNSKLGYKAGESHFFYTILLNFKTQFSNGYNYLTTDSSVLISKPFAPAYLLYSIGMDYKPNDNFSLYLSPLTGKTIIVSDQALADAGAFGVDPLKVNSDGTVTPGKKTLTQLGAYLRFVFKKDVMTNVNFQTKLELFSNYLKHPQNIAINWENLLALKVNKFISANIATQLIYDDIIPVAIVKEQNNVKTITGYGPRTQFKEVFGVGLSYKF